MVEYIDLKDFLKLNKPFFLILDKEFNEQLIGEAVKRTGSQRKLVDLLNSTGVCIKPLIQQDISRIMLGKVKTRIDIFLSVIDFLKIDLEQIRTKIKYICTLCGGSLDAEIFPLKKSEDMAFLIAKCMGDGGVGKYGFYYYNSNSIYLEEVKDKVIDVFGNIKFLEKAGKGATGLFFPTVVGQTLVLSGAPKGAKVKLSYEIPTWIMNGTKRIKKAFLRGLFEDEGWIEKTNFRIGISFAKKKDLEDNLISFINQISILLKDFGMLSKINKDREYRKKDEFHIQRRLYISHYHYLDRFCRRISLKGVKKIELINMLQGFRLREKIRYPKELLIELIQKKYKNDLFKPEDIAKDFGLSVRTGYKLTKFLVTDEKLAKIRNGQNVSFKWRI